MTSIRPAAHAGHSARRARLLLVVLAPLMLVAACHPSTPATPAEGDKAAAADDEKEQGVTLSAEQVATLGVTVETAAASERRDEAIGYGLVMNHDAIAQAIADLIAAQAASRLSNSALARARKLNGTPGAVSADIEETAAQKAEVDAAALTATQRKLSALFGMHPPWKGDETGATVQALGSGRYKLLRATFSAGPESERRPTTIRAARIGARDAAAGWRTSILWDAPADATVPGRSYFALLKTQDPLEGEHLQVFAATGESSSGVLVPAAAVLLSDGKYWCYVQSGAGIFHRVQIDPGTPVETGYFVKDGVAAGDAIVTHAAALLLAKETGGSAEAD